MNAFISIALALAGALFNVSDAADPVPAADKCEAPLCTTIKPGEPAVTAACEESCGPWYNGVDGGCGDLRCTANPSAQCHWTCEPTSVSTPVEPEPEPVMSECGAPLCIYDDGSPTTGACWPQCAPWEPGVENACIDTANLKWDCQPVGQPSECRWRCTPA